jgi:hypothetical protein
MPNTEPIAKYLAAVAAQKEGDTKTAGNLLAQAMGVRKPSTVITGSVDRLLTPGTLANEVALEIVASEVSKKRSKDGNKR